MTPGAALMAFQASGQAVSIISNLLGNSAQKKAMELEQKEIAVRMQEETLKTTEASYLATKEMRKTLAAQAVIAGARGSATGAGSQLALLNDSWRAFEEDESIRDLNLNSTLYGLKGKQAASRINSSNQSAATFGKISSGLFSQLSTNSLFNSFKSLGSSSAFAGAKASVSGL